jgi:hypothetical protein
MMSTLTDFFGPPVHVYTRREALDDGVLIDVTDLAKQAGFKVPVAITAAVEILVNPTQLEAEDWGQSRTRRLWDVLWMARFYAKQNLESSEYRFQVIFQFAGRAGHRAGQRTLSLKCNIGPGDEGEPVITILTLEED